MPGNENMTLAELIRAGLALESGQERRFTATLDGGEVYEVRLFAQGQPGGDGDRGVTSIDHRGTGNESDGVTSIDRPTPAAGGGIGNESDGVTSIDRRRPAARDGGGQRPDRTFQLELTRRP